MWLEAHALVAINHQHDGFECNILFTFTPPSTYFFICCVAVGLLVSLTVLLISYVDHQVFIGFASLALLHSFPAKNLYSRYTHNFKLTHFAGVNVGTSLQSLVGMSLQVSSGMVRHFGTFTLSHCFSGTFLQTFSSI